MDALEMYNKLKYSREEEDTLLDFKSHEEAVTYFKNKHGDNFVYAGSQFIGKEDVVHFYDLILNEKAYYKGKKSIEEESFSYNLNADDGTDMNFTLSYQRVEITENGEIHMVH